MSSDKRMGIRVSIQQLNRSFIAIQEQRPDPEPVTPNPRSLFGTQFTLDILKMLDGTVDEVSLALGTEVLSLASVVHGEVIGSGEYCVRIIPVALAFISCLLNLDVANDI